MSIFRAGGLARTGIKKLVPLMGLLALVASQHAAAVNLIDPDDHDWRWELGAEPTFPNECYGEGDLCLVDTDDNDADKANDGDNQLFDVWVPDGAGPFPIFIHAHGGGFTGGSKKRMALAGPLLANDDVVFVTTNYRLEGQTPEGVLRSIDDVIALIELLKTDEKYKVNPDQIFIGGGSAGGVITNYIAYNEKVTGIKGLWHWNLYLAESQPVDLRDTELLESLALPVVHGHPEPYNTHNSHSARDAFDHAKLNWEVGNGGTFFKALNEHPSMIGYPDKDVPEAEAWDQIQQIWIDGEWHLNNDHDDLTIEQEWDLNSQSPTFEQPLAEPTIDTGVKMLNLAEWIYGIVDVTPPSVPELAGINAGLNNVEVELYEWPNELHSQLGDMIKYAFLTRPKDYSGKLPLIISLHGGGGIGASGTTLEAWIGNGSPNGWDFAELANKDVMFLDPFSDAPWVTGDLNRMLDYVLENFSDVDPDRIYVIGYSAGGGGTYKWIKNSSERFAAAAPSGFSAHKNGYSVENFKHLPIWTAVGEEDTKSPGRFDLVNDFVDDLLAAGNTNVSFRTYPGLDHPSGGAKVYTEVGMVDFLLGFTSSQDDQVSDEELLVDIQQLYIGILGRAADQPGLDYWVNEIETGSLTLENTRASFTHQVEYASLYGGLDSSTLVTRMYQNFLERDPDEEGLAYWVSELDSGSVNPDQLVNALINAVEDPTAFSEQALLDKSVLSNKVTVATYFTSAFSTATVDADYLTTAQQAIADVDDSSDSVTSATTYVDSALDGLSSSPWIVNSDGTRSQFIFEANSNLGVLVNLQSTEEVVLSGETYTYVEATGVPSYSVQLSQTEIDALNNRPNAATDFISGSSTIATTENAVAFGQDIGFQSRSSCNTNGGFGYWPPGPECPENVSHQSSFNTNPSANSSICETGLGTMGLYVNGTAIFNWGDGQSYNSQGAWQNLAPIAEQYDVDICGGHAAAGEYHHHFYSSCLADLVGDTGSGHSPIYGFAADGYAMHGPWHASEVLAISAWAIRDYSAGSSTGCSSEGERSCALVDPYDAGQGVQASSSGPSITTNVNTLSGNTLLAYAGFYYEDYYWDSSLTSQGGEYLDQYNGHDHDELGYHYHMTVTQGGDSSLTPSFPFTIGPRFRGQLDSEALTSCATSGGPGGSPP